MLVPIPGQLVPDAPAPVPAGITYAESQMAGPNDVENYELMSRQGQDQQLRGKYGYQEQVYFSIILFIL